MAKSIQTKMYKNHLESFMQKKGMTWKTKAGIIIPVMLIIGFGLRDNSCIVAASEVFAGETAMTVKGL